MDGYGQSRALDGDRRRNSAHPGGPHVTRCIQAPRRVDGQMALPAPWAYKREDRSRSRARLHLHPDRSFDYWRASFHSISSFGGGCRAAEATAGAAPAASAAAAAEGARCTRTWLSSR